jgi:transcriptional regulator with XRE-family HTH domain
MATTMLDKESIGKHLRELRLAKGKTVAQMSEETGLGETALRNYECGLRIPRYEAMFNLAAYFGTTVDHIFFSS